MILSEGAPEARPQPTTERLRVSTLANEAVGARLIVEGRAGSQRAKAASGAHSRSAIDLHGPADDVLNRSSEAYIEGSRGDELKELAFGRRG